MNPFFFFLTLITFLQSSLFAQDMLTLNPMVKELLVHLGLPDDKIDVLELHKDDPHHHEWTPGQIKKLLSAKLLIAPPLELNPGLSSILKRRTLPTFELKVKDKSEAHFWFYPKVSCILRAQLEVYFKKTSTACPYEDLPLPALQFKKIVVTHNAFAPLFAPETLLALGGSHEEHFTSEKLKAFQLQMKSMPLDPILFVQESPYHGKIKIEQLKRPQDKIITIALVSRPELFSSLKQFIKDLNELKVETSP